MISASEEARLHALMQLKLLDTPPSESFDRITRMASRIFNLPIAAVSLTDSDRQWFKSRVGVDHCELQRDKAPCAEVAESTDILVIPDLLRDKTYRDSPLAQAGIRFYAGAPLVTRDGFGLGAMCVLGPVPRTIEHDERKALMDLASMVMAQIELQHAFGRIEPVSGLPNRHQMLDDLHDQVREKAGALRSVVMLDLIESSRLSDAIRVLGPSMADDFIRECTRVAARTVGPEIKIYQVGATQFAWLLDHEDAHARDRRLAEMPTWVADLLKASEMPALANPVVGIAPFQLGAVTGEDAIRAAHGAVQEARSTGSLVTLFSEDADTLHKRRFRLLSDMRDAMTAEDQLSLVYQPRIDLRTGRCVGAEALLRWRHPVLGDAPPGEFIPMIERTELARPVTQWVISHAIEQLLSWRHQGLDLTLSVNVSPANLEEDDFVDRLLQCLQDAGLPRSAVEVEVTEGALVDKSRAAQLRRLKEAGIRVAIDDFGTGYSSLSYLRSLPADVVKIDQSFIRRMTGDSRGQVLVRSMIDMARGLDLHVVAEGIEDEGAYDHLRVWGCDEAQGFFIARPMAAAGFTQWLGRYVPRPV